MTKVLIKPDADGNLVVPKEVLGEVAPDVIYSVEREGKTIRLEPQPRKLHEIEDPEERIRAFRDFVKAFARPSGGALPDWHVIRDGIYD